MLDLEREVIRFNPNLLALAQHYRFDHRPVNLTNHQSIEGHDTLFLTTSHSQGVPLCEGAYEMFGMRQMRIPALTILVLHGERLKHGGLL